MGYYQFNPKNHICSLAWTGIVFLSQFDLDTSFVDKVLTTGFLGGSTVLVGINIREQEKKTTKKIVDYINENRQVTVAQIANLIHRSGQESRKLLNTLVKEERIEMTNRPSDMAVIYTPIE